MATLRKRKGKWTVEIRRKGHRKIYATFVQKSDARSFINKTESDIQQSKFKDISEAANTSLRTVLHRYIREKLQHKQDKKRERSKFNVILRHDICRRMLSVLYRPLENSSNKIIPLILGRRSLAILFI